MGILVTYEVGVEGIACGVTVCENKWLGPLALFPAGSEFWSAPVDFIEESGDF